MAALEWDKAGARTYQGGVDRGVLYLANGTAVPWNGLTAIEENGTLTSAPYYLDGRKFMDRQTPGDFAGKLKAFTYPDEFDEVMGMTAGKEAVTFHDQPTQTFGLAYRTLIGNDVDGQNAGYKLHLLYNLIAIPDGFGYATLGDKVGASEFSWTLSGTPVTFPGKRPTAHISFNTFRMDPDLLKQIEGILYGTSTTNARIPTPTELMTALELAYSVKDNGDGTFTIVGTDSRVQKLDDTTYQVNRISTTPVDDDSYTIEEEV